MTHDQQEAFALADRVAIMEAGISRQIGKPAEVYNRPAAFVAGFLGKANLLPGRFVGLADDVTVRVRPENVVVGKQTGHTFEAFVGQAVMEGAIVQYTLDHNGTRTAHVSSRRSHAQTLDSVSISFPTDQYQTSSKVMIIVLVVLIIGVLYPNAFTFIRSFPSWIVVVRYVPSFFATPSSREVFTNISDLCSNGDPSAAIGVLASFSIDMNFADARSYVRSQPHRCFYLRSSA